MNVEFIGFTLDIVEKIMIAYRRISKSMIKNLQQMHLAIKKVLRERNYFLIFAVATIIFLGFFILVPLVTIPGNNLKFQLGIFRSKDYLLMIFLAVLAGLNISLQVYSLKMGRGERKLTQSALERTSSGIFTIFGAVAGTAACASCLASLFGLIGLGTGSVFFVLKNQPYFLFGAIALMLISLFFAARKVNVICNSC